MQRKEHSSSTPLPPAQLISSHQACDSQNCWVEESLAQQQNDNRSSRHYPEHTSICRAAHTHPSHRRIIGFIRHTEQLIETELDRKTRVYASTSITHRWDASRSASGEARKIPPSSSNRTKMNEEAVWSRLASAWTRRIKVEGTNCGLLH